MKAVSGLVSAVTLGLSLIKPEEAYAQDDWEPRHCEFTLSWEHPRTEMWSSVEDQDVRVWVMTEKAPPGEAGRVLIDHSLVRKAWLVPAPPRVP